MKCKKLGGPILFGIGLSCQKDNLMRGGHANDCECKGLNQ